jgi:Tfp pilus assembly PilM family ATPase
MASGAYLARVLNDSISVSTELIHPVSARSSNQARNAGDFGSAWASLTTAAELR